VQVDGTFLTGKYHGTLLTVISQDGNRNIFSLAFVIVEGETKEALIWFFQLLREHVTPQDNLCLIIDRGRAILYALQSEEVGWEGDGLSSVYCIRHIASNFNKRFKNAELKRQLIDMGTFFSHYYHCVCSIYIHNFVCLNFFYIATTYEMKQPTLMAKLSAMLSEFQQAVSWIDQISLEKWTQAYDGGKRFGHMTTNLAECINSVLKGTRSLPICAIVKTTFERRKNWFFERGTKTECMLRADYLYPEDITAQLRKNEQQSAMCIV